VLIAIAPVLVEHYFESVEALSGPVHDHCDACEAYGAA
jgi:hypothetical protein